MIARTKSLLGRRALITGASQGLGLEVARAYVAHGAHVAVCARTADTLAAAAEELKALAAISVRVLHEPPELVCPAPVNRLPPTAVVISPEIPPYYLSYRQL